MPPEASTETVENPYGEGDVAKVTGPDGAWHVHALTDNPEHCSVCRGLGVTAYE